MARIKNIELPNQKHIVIGLTAIYGIGRKLAEKICDDAKVERTTKVADLTEAQIAALRAEIDKYEVEGDLIRDVQLSIKNKMEQHGNINKIPLLSSENGIQALNYWESNFTIIDRKYVFVLQNA